MIAVRWSAAAQNEVAQIWLAAQPEDRREITRVVESLEAELRRNPHLLGEGDPAGERRVTMGSIGMDFRVSATDSFVHVYRVWRIAYSP